MPPWLGLLLLTIPVVFVAAFGTRQVRESADDRSAVAVPEGWVAARGVVVDEQTSRRRRRTADGTRKPLRRPVITYQSVDGREITFTSRIRAVGTPRPGALVGIYHDPVDPTRACIAPEALQHVTAPMAGASKVIVGIIWSLAALIMLIFVVVLFDA